MRRVRDVNTRRDDNKNKNENEKLLDKLNFHDKDNTIWRPLNQKYLSGNCEVKDNFNSENCVPTWHLLQRKGEINKKGSHVVR